MTYIVSEDEHNETITLDNLSFYIGSLNITGQYVGYLNSEIKCPKCGFPIDGQYSQDQYNDKNKEYNLECFECDWKLHKKYNSEKNQWIIQK